MLLYNVLSMSLQNIFIYISVCVYVCLYVYTHTQIAAYDTNYNILRIIMKYSFQRLMYVL